MRRKRTTTANTTISTGMSQGSDSHPTEVTTFRLTGRLPSLNNGRL